MMDVVPGLVCGLIGSGLAFVMAMMSEDNLSNKRVIAMVVLTFALSISLNALTLNTGILGGQRHSQFLAQCIAMITFPPILSSYVMAEPDTRLDRAEVMEKLGAFLIAFVAVVVLQVWGSWS
jgi:uncharacterized membrane protein YfcA